MEETKVKSKDIAVITGASKGIGRAIAVSVAKLGYQVAIFDVLRQEGLRVVKEIEEIGGNAIYVSVDISSEDNVLNGAKLVEETFGTPTVLVNNAVIFPRESALDISFENWIKVINVNLAGAFLCSRTFAPGMLNSGGVIVNIASGVGLQGTVRGSHYAASKAGVIALTRSLALEWAPTIRVNSIIPGVTDTDQPRDDIKSDKELYSRGSRIPLGRIGEPDDIAKAVCFFIHRDSSYITGQSLCVNGGAIMR